jgi:YbbR domain-containing protein
VSEKKSLWGLRLLAIALAVLAWFLATADRRETRTGTTAVDASINYSTPEQMMILEPVEEVRVGIRGTSSQIQNLNPFQVSVNVDLRNAERGTAEVNLAPRDVLLPEGLEVISIEPNQFVVDLDRVVQVIKPVEETLVGEPAAGAVVLRSEVVETQVLIRGPESLVNDLQSLVTSPVSLDGHALDFEQRAQVVSPDAKIQIVGPFVVTVRVALEIPTVGASR